jgi:hypothetical protein
VDENKYREAERQKEIERMKEMERQKELQRQKERERERELQNQALNKNRWMAQPIDNQPKPRDDNLFKKNAERDKGEKSYDNDLMNYAIQDKDYLIEQIRLIDPNIILCCSTFEFAKKLYPDFTIITDKVIYVDGKILINFFHPSNRKSYASQFNQLTEILTTAFVKLKVKFILNENYKPTFLELTSIKLRKKDAIYSQQFELASSLNEREKELTQKLKELKKLMLEQMSKLHSLKIKMSILTKT